MKRRDMVRIFTFVVVALLGLVPQLSRAQRDLCRQGLYYKTTAAKEWGQGHPVLTAVEPFSPAHRSGLRQGDVLEAVDEVSTLHLSAQQINALLQGGASQHVLQVRRSTSGRFKVLLSAECKREGVIDERELSELLALCSPMDASQERISYPFTYSTGIPSYIEGAKTFAFARGQGGDASTEDAINSSIAKALEAKGLKQSVGADLIVRTYYDLHPTNASASGEESLFSWRYSTARPGYEAMGVLGQNAPAPLVRYSLTLGITLERSGHPDQSWTVEAKEALSGAMTLPEYASMMVGMMLLPYPSTPSGDVQTYTIHTRRYYYTGLSYHEDDMGRVADVAYGSPAFSAGIRAGDRIKAINGVRMPEGDMGQIYERYLNFVERGQRYLEPDLSAYSPEGGRLSARPWGEKYYDEVASLLSRGRNALPLAYVFGFRPYVLPEGRGEIVFELTRSGVEHVVIVRPELRDETIVLPN